MNVAVDISHTTCCVCGIVFAFETEIFNRRKEDHQWFCCPSGHRQHFVGETETEKLRREVERLGAINSNLHSELSKCEKKTRRKKK